VAAREWETECSTAIGHAQLDIPIVRRSRHQTPVEVAIEVSGYSFDNAGMGMGGMPCEIRRPIMRHDF